MGLSFGDFDVINTLRRRGDPGGTNPKLLAASALITTGAMTTRLDRLERAGLLVRRPDPSDGRAVLVQLTDRGGASPGERSTPGSMPTGASSNHSTTPSAPRSPPA